MWCSNCQHGHIPVMRFIKDLGKEVSVCPCCGVELHDKVISSKEEQILEIAKRMGVKIAVGSEAKPIMSIGIEEDKPIPVVEAITTDNLMAKLAPEVELAEATEKPVIKKPMKKK